MQSKLGSYSLRVLVAVLFVYLLVPVILVFPLSFSGDAMLAFPPSRWGVRWYSALFRDGVMARAFGTSMALAAIVTVLSILIALPAAWVITRQRSAVTDVLFNVFTAPLLLPTIVLGLAILLVFASLGMLGNFPGLVLAHMTLTLPYSLRVLTTSFAGLNLTIEDAAASLGARPFTVFHRITLPAIKPGIVAAASLAFLVSFDEVVITLFLTGPQLTTLPVELYRRVEMQADPMVASVSALLVLMTLVVVLIVDRSMGLAKTFMK